MGFIGSPGDLHRFGSRYRLAKSFREVALDSYTAETASGYSALFRVFVSWSAFEQLLKICGLTIDGIAPQLTPYHPDAVATKIHEVPGHREFLGFVLRGLRAPGHRIHVKAFLEGAPCTLLYLPAGIRHIFAHGILTPNSGARDPEPVKQIADLLCEFLFRVMDGQFTGRLRTNGFAV
jgi:hypothetical protein